MKDLFGRELSALEEKIMQADGQPRKGATKANGYAARPGSGPAGETCKTCKFSIRVSGGSKSYWKCLKIRTAWTHGPGSDIRLKSPACRWWEKETNETDAGKQKTD